MAKALNRGAILKIASYRLFRVHLYKWSAAEVRKITRRMAKDGLLEIVRREGDMLVYRTKPPKQESQMGTIKAMIPVTSSTITAMGHDEVSQTMKVEFKNGSVYQYQHVGSELFNSIVGAESVGKAFDAKIKKNASAHPYTKVA